MTQIAQFKVDVDSIKRVSHTIYCEVRAFGASLPQELSKSSVFFELDDPSLAPLVGEGLLVTVENQRTPSTSSDEGIHAYATSPLEEGGLKEITADE